MSHSITSNERLTALAEKAIQSFSRSPRVQVVPESQERALKPGEAFITSFKFLRPDGEGRIEVEVTDDNVMVTGTFKYVGGGTRYLYDRRAEKAANAVFRRPVTKHDDDEALTQEIYYHLERVHRRALPKPRHDRRLHLVRDSELIAA